MLKNIRIKNFKALRDTGDLEIKPLTFLVGPNSSGKTSFFQFLLALRQTNQHQTLDYPLILQDYVDLGSYKDLIFNHNEKDKLSISFSFEDHKEREIILRKFSYEFSFESIDSRAGKIYLKRILYTGPFNFTEIFKDKKQQPNKKGKDTTFEKLEVKEWKFDNVRVSILRKSKKIFYIFKFKDPIEIRGKSIPVRIGQFHKITHVRKSSLLPFPFFDLPDKVINFFDNLHHIGPLREEPQRVYTATGIVPVEVGRTGKRSIDAIIIKQDKMDLLKYWLDKFNISSDITVDELREGSNRYEVILKDIHTGINVNLADVGFGASQVLPIIIEFLISPSDATILIEQPEIHLHPKAQAMMGELLVDIVKGTNRKLIVETHSDLILSRVCTMVAEGKIDLNDVVIYYFNPQCKGTKILKININENGQYENFPKGFFEERYDEAIKRAKIK
jgi:predicted ATPase